MNETATTRMEDGAFVIARRFAAPRPTVWRAWTEEAALRRWFGPAGCTMPHAALDLRVGGFFHYGLRMADGTMVWGRWTFHEITPPERLVLIQTFSDKAGGATRNPWDATWPLRTLSTMTLEEVAGGTLVTVRWAPHEASAAERRTFEAGFESMTGGWGGTLDRLAAELAQH